MSIVHVVYADESKKPEYFAYQDYVLSAFSSVGAHVVEEKTFLCRPEISKDDKLICFFVNNKNAARIFSTVTPDRRWSYIIDERADSDNQAYRQRLEFLKTHNVNKTIVTYQNVQHLQCLTASGITYVTMPCCVPKRRPRTEKPHGIFAVGTFDPAAYKTRFKIRNLLTQADAYRNNIVHQYIEPAIGEKHYDVLDQYQLGITCKADYRDRMVQKYVEFGMCHVLPIGDCPTYMPEDMKRLMLNVEGMSDTSIVLEVQRLLNNPLELTERQEKYSTLVHQRYDLLTNISRVLDEIQRS